MSEQAVSEAKAAKVDAFRSYLKARTAIRGPFPVAPSLGAVVNGRRGSLTLICPVGPDAAQQPETVRICGMVEGDHLPIEHTLRLLLASVDGAEEDELPLCNALRELLAQYESQPPVAA